MILGQVTTFELIRVLYMPSNETHAPVVAQQRGEMVG